MTRARDGRARAITARAITTGVWGWQPPARLPRTPAKLPNPDAGQRAQSGRRRQSALVQAALARSTRLCRKAVTLRLVRIRKYSTY
jgi:hypothetical protein